MGIERGGDRIGIRADDELVIGQGVRPGLAALDAANGDAGVLGLGEGRPGIAGLGQDAPDAGLGGGGIGHTEQHDRRRDLRHGHRIGGQLHGGRGHLGHRDRDVTVEPGRDVIGPADADPFGRQHLVDPLDHLRVEGLVEIDALDRREASEQLAQGGVLLR